MSTTVLLPTPEHIQQLAAYIRDGEIVAFPTETVYGLGADATKTSAVQKIFTAKNRPANNPLIVHVAHREDIGKYVYITHPLEELLIEKLMPGPLTLVMPTREMISPLVLAGRPTVAIRVPAHPVAQAFLEAVDCPIAAPSANRSGRPSPTTAEMVLADMDGLIPSILDGWPCAYGIESTVAIVLDGKVAIRRPGFVTKEDLQQVVGPDVEVYFATTQLESAPGNMYKHYSPGIPVYITQDITNSVNEGVFKKAIIIATTETRDLVSETAKNNEHIIYMNRWSKNDLVTCASRLYQLYHEASTSWADAIYIEALPEQGLGLSIMNRVKKSAQQ